MNHLQQYLVDEFVEDYREGEISRRTAFRRIAGITGAAVAAQLLAACGAPTATTPTLAPLAAPATTASTAAAQPTDAQPNTAPLTAAPATAAATAAAVEQPATGSVPNSVAADDPAVAAQRVTFPGTDSGLIGYLARPSAEGTYPIVLVCHENRGLTPHIEDVTRRIAKAGYIGLAVDLLSRDGGTPAIADQDSIPGLLSGAPPERHVQDFTSGLTFAKAQPAADPKRVGMVGFCFGGGVTWLVASGLPELRAAVPFYGPPPPVDQVPMIHAAVFAVYAEQDTRINASIPDIEAAMKAAGKIYTKEIYPGVNHAFHNDTGQRYSAEQAQAAWKATLAWFGQYLAA